MKTLDFKPKNFLNRNKYYLALVLILSITVIWHFCQIYLLEKNAEKEKLGVINKYEMKLDSLNIANLQLTAKSFSWAVRSELLRGNTDQINQYFNEFVKTPGILKLQFINSENSVIEISTDKKDEGLINMEYTNIKDQETLVELSELKIISPISGMNKQIGILILEVAKTKSDLPINLNKN